MNQNNIMLEFKDDEILINKKLSQIDDIVLDFSDILANNNIKYALFSGYISNLLGSAGTIKNIDILIQNISFEKFLKLWLEIENTYESKNTDDPIDSYNAYLKNHHSLAIVKKNVRIADLMVRIVKDDIDRYILKYRKRVKLGERKLFISPLEIQILFNLSRGTKKDIEEARFLYGLSKEKLNMTMMERFLNELNIPKESFDNYLKKGVI